MMTAPVVCLFGRAGATGAGVTQGFPARGFALLAVMSDAWPDGVSRAAVARLLWPLSGQDKARAALRQLVRRVNNALPLPIIMAEGGADLRLANEGCTDLSLFRAWLRQEDDAATVRALLLYKAPLLPDLSGEDDPFGQWLSGLRQRLRDQVTALVPPLVHRLTRFGTCDVATLDGLLAAAQAQAPGSEALMREVRQAYARIGAADRVALVVGGLTGVVPAAPVAAGHRPGPLPHASVPRLALFCPAGAGAPALRAAQVMGELATCLAAWRSFAVLAPFSTFAVPADFGVPTDNAALRADYALSADLPPDGAGDLSLQMVHLPDQVILWSGKLSLEPDQIAPGLKRAVARVAATLASSIEGHCHGLLRQGGNPSALLHFLDGRGAQALCDLPHVRRARSSFARALMVDDRFAPAQARIAETLFVEWILCGGTDPELLAAARARAELAVQLDPAGATGHWVRGAVALYQRRFDHVADSFVEAEALAPHDADLLLEYADALCHLGDHSAAEARFAQALDLNPLPPDKLWWVGASIAFHAQDFGTAAARFDRMRDAEIGLGLRAASYAQSGRLPEARRWARRLKQALPGMTAEELCAISPNQKTDSYRRAYVEGLRLAAF